MYFNKGKVPKTFKVESKSVNKTKNHYTILTQAIMSSYIMLTRELCIVQLPGWGGELVSAVLISNRDS